MLIGRREFIRAGIAAALCAGMIRPAGAQPLPSYPAGMTDSQIDALLARAVAEIRAKNEVNDARWGFGDWTVDLERGVIGFATRDGGRIEADVQVIGTYVAARRSWMWGWDHPSVPQRVAAHARLVKQFAETQRLVAMTQRVMEDVGEDEVWGFTALAAHLGGAAGAYRGPTGGTLVFMTHGLPQPV